MTDGNIHHQLSMEFLAEFQDRLRYTEEKYRYIEDPVIKINGLLKEVQLFYKADRAFLVEIDWDIGVGICTYACCNDGIEPQIQVMQHIPVEKFMGWINKIRRNQPVIMDVETLDSQAKIQFRKTMWNGMNRILIAPFSNRMNTGIIGIGNPQIHSQNLSFLLVLGYAVISALNEIKLQERVDIAVQQISHQTETEIYVNCLGGLEIKSRKGVLNDENITADQCYRLLAYLLLNYQKTKAVRELADIIWNDGPVTDPYRDIKNVVYRLKRYLNLIELDDLVIGASGTFVINPKYHIYTDYERFEDACKRFFNATDLAKQRNSFYTAKDLYKGSLLPRCDHIHWFIPRTGFYQTLYLRLLKTYLAQLERERDYMMLQRIALEGLEMEPYDTDLMIYQIISMYVHGNRSIAQNFYRRIEAELTEEQQQMISSYQK